MTDPLHPRTTQEPGAARSAWQVLLVQGVLFLLVGAFLLGVRYFPSQFGKMEWEFGTMPSLLDALPPFGLGLGLLMSAAAALGHWRTCRLASLLAVLTLVFVVLAATIFGTVVPLAFRTTPDPGMLSGLKKASAKVAFQLVVYSTGFFLLARRGWQAAAGKAND